MVMQGTFQKSDHLTWNDPIIYFTLCSINLNMASISGMGNVKPVFNLDPCFMNHLWYDIVDSSINSFL